ncbi:MAG: helix-turn-helix domain-containing protein, partial [Candidatus Methanospirareceae archaeon]
MNIADGIVTEIFRNGKELPALLTRAIKQSLGVSVGEFSEKSGVPASTLYKILSGQRDPNLQTFRRIINTIRAIEEAELGGKRGRGSAASAAKEKRKFIAIICSRGCLDVLERTTITTENPRATFDLKEYAVASIEEAILAAVQAEKDGASALVCAPIVSSTVEKVVSIPLTTIRPRSSVARAIELAAK